MNHDDFKWFFNFNEIISRNPFLFGLSNRLYAIAPSISQSVSHHLRSSHVTPFPIKTRTDKIRNSKNFALKKNIWKSRGQKIDQKVFSELRLKLAIWTTWQFEEASLKPDAIIILQKCQFIQFYPKSVKLDSVLTFLSKKCPILGKMSLYKKKII